MLKLKDYNNVAEIRILTNDTAARRIIREFHISTTGTTDHGHCSVDPADSLRHLRIGIAVRKHNNDNVHSYRIPGLVTTNNSTLLASYDVRRDSRRDLQGSIDIGINRSTDGGSTWEPMVIALDMGEGGGLPQKFNGISDAALLVDKNTGVIFAAGLWMYVVIHV
jgi:hypothetical protein